MAGRRRRKGRRGRRRRPARRSGARRWLLRAVVVAVIAAGGWVAWLDLEVRARFEGQRWQVPARLYARPLTLYPGLALSPEALEHELAAAGYHPARRLDRPGSYVRRGAVFDLMTRRFAFWDGAEPSRRLRLRLAGGRLAAIEAGARPVPLVRLEPPLIGRIDPSHHEDRILVRLDEVPPALVAALLAIEDRRFLEHAGLSLRGIARAALANLRAGRAVQGGSTLTQQLVKNLWLSPERTFARKAEEAVMALLLEARYDKREILEAYLNEVFVGQQGRRAVHGFGLAARFWFGRPLDELRLSDLALLAGLVRAPSHYDPRRHPQRARARRDRVLAAMVEVGALAPARARAAGAADLGVTARPGPATTRHPAFVELVRRQLRRDYREQDLRGEGLRIFTTLDPRAQHAAESALAARAAALERARDLPRGSVQGAVVVTDSQTAEVLAVVGGREARAGGFNRALAAARPIGSLVKPAVYLAALERPERYHLVTLIEDGPVSATGADGRVWTPANYDRESHGPVPLVAALAHSYNQATVRLGLGIGLDRVRETLSRLGVERDLPRYPSLLLGALELAPLEVARVYQTVAAGGFRSPLRAIREVTGPDGRPLTRYGVSVKPAISPAPAFLLTAGLVEVMREGTGRAAAASLPEGLVVAGKTGTTDDLRDSWFAGFSGDRLAVVWLGRDDNRPVGLTGAGGALRVWTDVMRGVAARPLRLDPPPGVEWRWVNRASGRGAAPGCTGAVRLPFVAGGGPSPRPCPRAAGYAAAERR